MEISIQDSTQNAIVELPSHLFPALLKEISHPPLRLFARGTIPDPKAKFLCVVGSRRASQYGIDACRSLIKGLAGQNIVIVSGLALGIDTVAHEAALEAKLPTVAVVSSGLEWEYVYPRTNINLAKEIVAAGGALISEFSGKYQPHNYNFPERNRIMAGMSHATLVIEASMRSGTLITARLALEANRDVFAVPGSIFSKKSEGAHSLISNGALLVRNSDDIIAELGLSNNGVSRKIQNLDGCSEFEKSVYEALEESYSRAEIIEKIAGSQNEITIALSLLEMKGLITESAGKLRRA